VTPPGPSYLDRLAARSVAVGTVLCVGLDPDPAALPPEIATSREGAATTHDWGYTSEPGWLERATSQLPFELTGAQRKVLSEVLADVSSGRPMNRLVQGDVGSGKTVVAALAMLLAAQHGCQAVLMAPTEMLAMVSLRS